MDAFKRDLRKMLAMSFKMRQRYFMLLITRDPECKESMIVQI